MKYLKKLPGEKIYLSPISVEDAEQYSQWINNLEISKYLLFANQQIGVYKEQKILTQLLEQGAQIFAIVENETNTLLGNCSLFNFDFHNSSAELGIFIGSEKHLGKGYGTEAINLLLDYGFNILNLNNVMLDVYSYNTRAIKSYLKCGFKFIGRRREAKMIGRKKFDQIFMDILANEFTGSTLKIDLKTLKDENVDG